MRDEHLHPRVRAPLAEHVAGHVARGQAAQPAERQHAVRVVLADADASRPRLRSGRADRGLAAAVLEVLEDTAADLVGQLDALRARAAQLVGHRAQSVVRAGQPRRLGEALVEGDRVGGVRAVDRGLALDDGPGGELDLALHVLEAEVEDDVPERVVRALGVDVAARDADLVRQQALVVVVVGRHDHQPVAQRRDRARILVGEGLLDQDGRLPDVLPVDLIVVDAAQRGDQVAERLTGHPAPPARATRRQLGIVGHLVRPHDHAPQASGAVGRDHGDVDGVAAAADRQPADARRVEARVERPPARAEPDLEPGVEVHRRVGPGMPMSGM